MNDIMEIEQGILKILIVEGKEDEIMFSALLSSLQITDIKIKPIGGKQNIGKNLLDFVKARNFHSIRSLGIIRDADDNPSGAFASVCSALKNAGLPVPNAPLIIAGDDLRRVGVMILPGENRCGALEDTCLESVQKDMAIPCVDGYFQCLSEREIHLPTPAISKARVHAFLASKKEPDKRLGEAARAGYWNFESHAFESVKQFLQAMYIQEGDEHK